MSLPPESSDSARSNALRLLAIASLAVAAGCGSGSSQAGVPYPAPAPGASDMQAEAINRRISAAAAMDSLRGRGRQADLSNYRIGPNDLLDVGVFGADAFSGAYRVGETGEISMPLLGPIHAAGRTPREREEHLQARLGETYMRDPHVTVEVSEMQSHGVSVVGAVNQPGVYQISGSATLLEVLAMAQGLTAEAGSQVYVVRPRTPGAPALDTAALSSELGSEVEAGEQPDVIEVDLGALLESGETQQNLTLMAGDIVQVRPAGMIYVVGQVNRPGGYTTPPGSPMTVLQALAMAQGLGNTAAPGRSVIVREGPNGERVEIPVDLEAVLQGEDAPPQLVARDVLFIPNNGMKSFGLGVINALVSMVTFRGLVY